MANIESVKETALAQVTLSASLGGSHPAATSIVGHAKSETQKLYDEIALLLDTLNLFGGLFPAPGDDPIDKTVFANTKTTLKARSIELQRVEFGVTMKEWY